jgi:heterodisulfide reductase subunit C2
MNSITCIDRSLLELLDPDGKLNIAACLQCGRCSSGCTMRLETDCLPHRINRMIMLGLKDELLASRAIWTCVSCQTCVSRCPMKVDTPAVIDKLREMSKSAPARDLEKIRIFNDTLLSMVRRYGRGYEMGLMAMYKLRTRDLFSDVKKLPMMLRKGKLALLPPRTPGSKQVARIFDRVRARRAK